MKQIILNTIAILNRGERKKIVLLGLLDIIISVLDIAFLAMLLYIVHFYTDGAAAIQHKLSFLPSWLSDPGSLWPISIVFLLFFLKNLASFLVNKTESRFRFGIAARISENNLLRYLEGNYSDYVNIDSSVHSGQICQQPQEFCLNILEGLQQGLTELAMISFTVLAVLLFNAQLFLLLMVLLLPPVIIMSWLTRKKLQSAREHIRTSREVMWQHLQESIGSYVESNLYDKKTFFSERYSRSLKRLFHHLSDLRTAQAMPSRLAEVFAIFGLLILITLGHFSGSAHATSFVTLGAFLGAAYKIIPGIARLLNITGQIRTYGYAVNGLAGDSEEGRQTDGGGAGRVAENTPVPHIRSLACTHIHFNYGTTEILTDLNLFIKTGDFLGIRSDSGKGKTTLLNILLGFLAPGKGEVFFNEKLSDHRDRKAYWKHIAYVQQQPFIIHDSILANITLDEKKYEEQRLQHALALSGLDQLLQTLPGGIKSVIAENGKNVSGGQRQRIAIARALYKNADLIILDEPFSELDETSEERLLAHFKQLASEGKFIILITHNKNSLSYCNTTLSLNDQ